MTKTDYLKGLQGRVKTRTKHDYSTKELDIIVQEANDLTLATVKKEGRFRHAGFGTYVVAKRKARQGRNPQTGEPIKIKASRTVVFKPAAATKKVL